MTVQFSGIIRNHIFRNRYQNLFTVRNAVSVQIGVCLNLFVAVITKDLCSGFCSDNTLAHQFRNVIADPVSVTVCRADPGRVNRLDCFKVTIVGRLIQKDIL